MPCLASPKTPLLGGFSHGALYEPGFVRYGLVVAIMPSCGSDRRVYTVVVIARHWINPPYGDSPSVAPKIYTMANMG